ncbi:Ger(x)C family spore germination protein [Bacillus sp. YC2]|uniref:Ger(x)C family spore germination protein n=1 Tax=Bacillus sp. YC2 TaxID=2861287 RepID=UPI001CA6BB53|nr:Ger(x)C family spore germination protein [Bacillus sp. YC2]MBY8911341.1 Ger(x)C family spore germination protein [Bacillus sp. YC2]
MKTYIVIILCTLLLTGCWDSRNIEDLSLVIGVGLDKPEEENVQVTQQILIPTKASSEQSSSGETTKITSTPGETVHQALRTAALKNRRSFSQHLRVMLFSQNLLKDDIPLDALMNQFIKDNGTRRSCNVMTVPDQTKDIFTVTDQGEPASNTIYDLTENNSFTIRMMQPVTLGDISEKIAAGETFAIPQVRKVKGGGLEISGASIIKNKFWLANLTPMQVQDMNLFTGTVKGGVTFSKHKGYFLSFEIFSSKYKVKTKYKNGKFKFIVTRFVEGRLSEDWNPKEDSFKQSYIDEIKKTVTRSIHSDVTKFIDYLQHDLKVDITGLGDEVRIHYPDKWRKISSDWDHHFSESDIEFHVKVAIRDFGTKGMSQ